MMSGGPIPADYVDRRNRFLLALYEASSADPMNFVDGWELGRMLGLDVEASEAVIAELVARRWASTPETGPTVLIAFDGIRAAEAMLDESPHRAPTLRSRRELRVQLLDHLYRASGRDPSVMIDDFAGLAASDDERRAAGHFLVDSGLARHAGVDGMTITQRGIAFIEEYGTDASIRL